MKPEEDKDIEEAATGKTNVLVRYVVIVFLLVIVAGGILANLFKVSFVERDKWLETLKKRTEKEDQTVSPNRGNIYSADGKLMSTSMTVYELYIDYVFDDDNNNKRNPFTRDSFLTSKKNGIDSLAIYLSRKFNDRTAASYKTYLKKGFDDKRKALRVSSKRITYLDLLEIRQYPFFRLGSRCHADPFEERKYLFGNMAKRTIGTIDDKYDEGISKGLRGLEAVYDSLLRGETGKIRPVRVGPAWANAPSEDPVDGYDIVATIDTQIQDITEKALHEKAKELSPAEAIAIVMEVKTGEIKAITNLIRASNGSFYEAENRALNGLYEPGSTFKTAAMMVALEDEVCTPDKPIARGNGIFIYKGRTIRDHNANRGDPVITAEQAIWYSSNVGMAKIILEGYEHNPQKFITGLRRIGILSDLQLEISGARAPRINTPDSSRGWSVQSLPSMSYGAEIEIAPINTLAFYNAIANNGKMVRPIFAKEIQRNGKTVERMKTETIVSPICSDKTLKIIQSMLANTVANSKATAHVVHSEVVSIAGKTGTAQIVNRQGSVIGHNVSFCGYFPVDNPQYSCIVFMHRPNGSPSGGLMCGSVFKTIAEKVYSRQEKIVVRSMEADSMRTVVPQVKSGDAEAMAYVLDELNIKSTGKVKSDYAAGRRNPNTQSIDMQELAFNNNLVPNVTGMGAKDAVYVLEKCGLNVRLSGRGRVESQSVPSGQRVVKGQTITITLRN